MGLSTVETFKTLKLDRDKYIQMNPEQLQRYQRFILGIADDVIAYCEEVHIQYSLSGGTALGAVRHGGFIPWDDDIDINISGEDFPRFVTGFQKAYGEKYWIHTCETPGYGMVSNRIALKGSIYRTREDVDNEECGFFIDVFRIENTFDNGLLRGLHGILCMAMGFLLSCRNFYKNRVLMRELEKDNPQLRGVFELKILAGALLSFMSVTQWAVLTQTCYGLCRNSRSRYVSIPAGRKHYFKEMYRRDAFLETVKMDFEGRKWNIPKGYDSYLRTLYGDSYMVPVSREEREHHVVLELRFPEIM